ncbi:hypothetical protein E3N88_10486 [Mikania micrantha]|uniref:Uncharacterized protein n=1 Tax=Mikania micrantha TaxID=192012 RepID=A0A5N6PAT5_9ASTR|nr:hypothetical protein E3N88_10486 [Mikania micrantha]
MATSKLVLICNTEISRVVPVTDLPFRRSIREGRTPLNTPRSGGVQCLKRKRNQEKKRKENERKYDSIAEGRRERTYAWILCLSKVQESMNGHLKLRLRSKGSPREVVISFCLLGERKLLDHLFQPDTGHMYRTNWGIGHGLKDILEAHEAHHMYAIPPYPYLANDYCTQLSLFTHHIWIGPLHSILNPAWAGFLGSLSPPCSRPGWPASGSGKYLVPCSKTWLDAGYTPRGAVRK